MCVKVQGICSILADVKVIVVPERRISTKEDTTTVSRNNSQFYLINKVPEVGILSCTSMIRVGIGCNDVISIVCKGTCTKLSRFQVPIISLTIITKWIVEY